MIGILCFNSLRYAQYIYKYTNILDKANFAYEVIYWNRENETPPELSNWISYSKPIDTFQPFRKKISSFIGYVLFLKKTIREKKYDKLIIMTTQTAIPLVFTLIGRYKNKYIYDYRDVTYENIVVYKFLVNKIIKNSFFTAISSKGFLRNLTGCDKFVISHNSREFDFVDVHRTASENTRIVYWGMVRQPEFNYRICDLFAQDKRFNLIYHGAGYHKDILDYCNRKNYTNIFVTGAYQLSNIDLFVANTDFVLNAYENDKQQAPAMTVKFYDAIRYRLPMIVTSNSFMGSIIEQYGLGIAVDWENENSIDRIYQRLSTFDYDQFKKNVEVVHNTIQYEDTVFEDRLLEFAFGTRMCQK